MKTNILLFLVTLIVVGSLGCSNGDSTVKADAVGDDNVAVRQARTLIERAPDSPLAHTQLAAAFIRLGRETGNDEFNQRAEAAVARALELDPKYIPARKLNGSLMLTGHEFGEALVLARELQAESSTDPFVYGLLTDAHAGVGNYKEAVESAQKMVDLKPSSSSYARVAHMRSLHGDTQGAIEAFTHAARITDPTDREAQSWAIVQVGNEHWRSGRYDEAGKAFDEALAVFPDFYLALAGKGRVLASIGDLAGAADLLRRAQERHLNLDTVLLLGDVYARLGQAEPARAQFDLAQADENRLGSAYDPHRIALFWADRGINLEQAVRIAREDYAKQKDIYASDTLAWSLYKSGQFEEAGRHSRDAMRLGTKDALILFHAGMIAKANGDKVAARRLLNEAIKLNPGFDLEQVEVAKKTLIELS